MFLAAGIQGLERPLRWHGLKAFHLTPTELPVLAGESEGHCGPTTRTRVHFNVHNICKRACDAETEKLKPFNLQMHKLRAEEKPGLSGLNLAHANFTLTFQTHILA